jgi:hypothetical protein
MTSRLLLIPLVLLLAACGEPAAQSDSGALIPKDPEGVTATPSATPTSTSAQTSPFLRITSTGTPPPLTLLTPAVVVDDSTATPMQDPTPFSVSLPLESLYFELPGPSSHISGSLRVVGFGGPSQNDRVLLRLLGSDGRVMTSYSTYLSVYPGNAGRFFATLSYSIPTLAEDARLEVRTYSPFDGQVAHIATVDLVLLSLGSERIQRGFQGAERITIFYPRLGQTVSGGVVRVQGAAWLSADVPLAVQVLDRRGDVVGSLEIDLDVPEPGVVGVFDVQVPYDIPFSQHGRVAVYEPGDRIPGIVHYNSVYVILWP